MDLQELEKMINTYLNEVESYGEEGEYGHPHHRVVHKAVNDLPIAKVYFSLDTSDLALPLNIAIDELPRHAESIRIHAGSGVAYYQEQL
jgi:hypothetical protein